MYPCAHTNHTMLTYAAYMNTQFHDPNRTSTDAHEIWENHCALIIIYESKNQMGQPAMWINVSMGMGISAVSIPPANAKTAQKKPSAMTKGITGNTSMFTARATTENLWNEKISSGAVASVADIVCNAIVFVPYAEDMFSHARSRIGEIYIKPQVAANES